MGPELFAEWNPPAGGRKEYEKNGPGCEPANFCRAHEVGILLLPCLYSRMNTILILSSMP